MAKIFIKRHKINEDDANAANTNNTVQQATTPSPTDQNAQNNQNQVTGDPNQKFDALQKIVNNLKAEKDKKISVLQKQIDDLNSQFATIMVTHRKTAEAINAELTKAQLPTRVLQESVEIPQDNFSLLEMSDLRFSKKLFESKKGESLVKEWQKLLYSAIESAKTSNTITSIEELWTPARIIKNKIYDWESKDWNSEIIPKNHWSEVSEFIRDYIVRSRDLSYSKSELDRIMEKLEERVRGSKSFSWIFGRDIDKK